MVGSLPTEEFVFRLVPLLLLAGTTLNCLFLVFNNVSAPRANLSFTRHVLEMDTTSREGGTMWRAVTSPALQWAAYGVIVAAEAVCAVFGGIGTYRLIVELDAAGADWEAAKTFGYLAFLVALFVWYLFFQVVGTGWFLSWQSDKWNGIRDSTRINLISIAGVILLRLA